MSYTKYLDLTTNGSLLDSAKRFLAKDSFREAIKLIPDELSFEDKPTGSAAFAVLLFLVRQYEETAYPVIVDMPKSVWDARAMEETKTFLEPHYRVLSESHQYDAVTLRLNND